MSTTAILFIAYLVTGLVLMVFAVASRGNRERTKGLDSLDNGDALDAGLMIFIALLWPVWLLMILSKKNPPS